MDFTGQAPRIEYWIWVFFVDVATYGIGGINEMLSNSLGWGFSSSCSPSCPVSR